MEIKININVCRVCLKPPVEEPVSLFGDQNDSNSGSSSGHAGGSSAGGAGGPSAMGALARQFTAVTQLEVSGINLGIIC